MRERTMNETPIFESVVRDQGWSPDDLSPPFDLDRFLRKSVLKAQASSILTRGGSEQVQHEQVRGVTTRTLLAVPVKRPRR
jgi:hypothetical protein